MDRLEKNRLCRATGRPIRATSRHAAAWLFCSRCTWGNRKLSCRPGNQKTSRTTQPCASTVASAAPATPKAGKGPGPKNQQRIENRVRGKPHRRGPQHRCAGPHRRKQSCEDLTGESKYKTQCHDHQITACVRVNRRAVQPEKADQRTVEHKANSGKQSYQHGAHVKSRLRIIRRAPHIARAMACAAFTWLPRRGIVANPCDNPQIHTGRTDSRYRIRGKDVRSRSYLSNCMPSAPGRCP